MNTCKYSPRPKGDLFDGGDYIRAKLMERNLKQKDLAYAIDMIPAVLSDIINGHRRPSRRNLIDISIALSIDITDWKKHSEFVNNVFQPIGETFMGGGEQI